MRLFFSANMQGREFLNWLQPQQTVAENVLSQVFFYLEVSFSLGVIFIWKEKRITIFIV